MKKSRTTCHKQFDFPIVNHKNKTSAAKVRKKNYVAAFLVVFFKHFFIQMKAPKYLMESPLRLSQMLDNRLYFRLQERVPARVVIHGLKLRKQHGTSVYPAV
jgi:hypothetical protein